MDNISVFVSKFPSILRYALRATQDVVDICEEFYQKQ